MDDLIWVFECLRRMKECIQIKIEFVVVSVLSVHGGIPMSSRR